MNEMIDNKIFKLLDERKELVKNIDEDIDKLRKSRKMECPCCNKKTKVKDISLVKNYYIEDGGPCIGDRERLGDTCWICPKCNKEISYYKYYSSLGSIESCKSKWKEISDFISVNYSNFKSIGEFHPE